MTTIPNMNEGGTPMPVLDVPADESDFASSDGRYFVTLDGILSFMHDTLHDLTPMAAVQGYDPDVFSAAGHVLLNIMRDLSDQMRLHIATAMMADADVDLHALLGLPDEPEA